MNGHLYIRQSETILNFTICTCTIYNNKDIIQLWNSLKLTCNNNTAKKVVECHIGFVLVVSIYILINWITFHFTSSWYPMSSYILFFLIIDVCTAIFVKTCIWWVVKIQVNTWGQHFSKLTSWYPISCYITTWNFSFYSHKFFYGTTWLQLVTFSLFMSNNLFT